MRSEAGSGVAVEMGERMGASVVEGGGEGKGRKRGKEDRVRGCEEVARRLDAVLEAMDKECGLTLARVAQIIGVSEPRAREHTFFWRQAGAIAYVYGSEGGLWHRAERIEDARAKLKARSKELAKARRKRSWAKYFAKRKEKVAAETPDMPIVQRWIGVDEPKPPIKVNAPRWVFDL